MAEIPDNIIQIIKRFIDYLEKADMHIQQAILYGSYANGRYNEYSDIDLALVSDKFSGSRFYDLDKLRDARFAVSTDIAPMPYRPEDFIPDNLFVKEILKTGINIEL